MSKVLTDQIEKRTGGTAIDLPAAGKWPAASIADDAITADKILADSITTAKILDNNVTLAKLSDGTQGGTIYYGASGAPTELVAGTSGQFLQTTGAAANPTWATVTAATLAPAFSVCTNAITGITAATNTKIVLDREVFDSDGAFDATTNYRFTVPAGQAGKYFFSGEIAYLITGTIGSAGSNNQIQIHINGVESGTVNNTKTNQSNTSSIAMVGSWMLDLAAADYVELWGYISSSGTPTLQYNGNATVFRTHMMGFKLVGI